MKLKGKKFQLLIVVAGYEGGGVYTFLYMSCSHLPSVKT